MKKHFLAVLCGLALLAAMFGRAEEGPEPIDPDEINGPAEILPGAGEMVGDALRTYAREHGIAYGSTDGRGRTFHYAMQSVSVGSASPQWGKARVLAFEKAVHKVMSQCVADVYGKQRVTAASEFFKDQPTPGNEFPEEAVSRSPERAVYDKLLAIRNAELDGKLEGLGIDPRAFAARSPAQRFTEFRDAFQKAAAERAVGEISGMAIVQTFEGSDEKGNHAIGVVMCHSPRLRQVAFDMLNGRAPLLTGKPGKPFPGTVPEDGNLLRDQFGVRVLFDEKGSPVLVSYGQWSHSYTGKDDRTTAVNRDAAIRTARMVADTYITEFLNLNMTVQNEGERAGMDEWFRTKDEDGAMTAGQTADFVDRLLETSRSAASAGMAGRRTAGTWTFRHPNGNEIVGVVRVWTMENLAAADAVRNWTPAKGPRAGEDSGRPEPGTGGDRRELRRGIDTDVSDF